MCVREGRVDTYLQIPDDDLRSNPEDRNLFEDDEVCVFLFVPRQVLCLWVCDSVCKVCVRCVCAHIFNRL